MNKLSEAFKNLINRWKALTKSRKIAFGAILVGVVAALLYLSISLGSTKYEVLFANMDPKDAAAVYTDLTGKKVNVKIQGNTILVPKDQVDQLRMQTLAEVPMTNGSQGFELLDKSQFGETDAQFKVDYQRALQGELERTIEIFPQVEGARVSLVIPDDSDFVKDTTPGKAFVTLKLKPNQKLTVDQVKSIVALVSGSVKNLPKENVEITDTVTLLTQGLYDNNTSLDSATSTEEQQQLKLNYEKQLQDKVLNMLQAVYGQDKVKVLVNADLNFDAQQTDTTTYDPKSVTVSEQNTKDTTDGSNSQTSSSPVDNNMVNNTTTTTTTNPNGTVTTHESSTKNYDVSKTDSKTIKAPGEVKRLTTSVVIDGNLDNATKASVQNMVASAVGFDGTRGDTVDVESMAFDTTLQDNAKKDLDAINKSIEQEKRTKIYTMIGVAVGVLLVLGAIVITLRRRRNESDEILPKGIDITIGNESDLTQPLAQIQGLEDAGASSIQKKLKFKPIDLDVENEKTHIENEIRKYASNKPDQVADIVKSWLSEDER